MHAFDVLRDPAAVCSDGERPMPILSGIMPELERLGLRSEGSNP